MHAAELRKALRQRQPIFGTLITSTSPDWVPAARGLGLDFVFLDTEHIALDRHALGWMCRAYEASGLAPMVRIPSPDPYQASCVLDGGAAAVLAPYIETPQQIRALVGAVKQKPVKGAMLDAVLNDDPDYASQTDYTAAYNASRSLLINVESVPALDRIDALLDVEGLDGIVIGPHDLSVSLGVAEQWDHPRFVDAVRTIFQTAREHGMSAGMHMVFDEPAAYYEHLRDAGANIALHQGDLFAFRYHIGRDIQAIRQIMGGDATDQDGVLHI